MGRQVRSRAPHDELHHRLGHAVRRRRQQRGVAAIWLLLALSALAGLASLGVDYGRVQLVKAELRGAADAAALAAAAKLGDVSAAQSTAAACAAENRADGASVILDTANDVEFGSWDEAARAFTPAAGTARAGATAVRVWARRTAARGNPVPLSLGGLFGRSACDVQASAIASLRPLTFGVVGLDYIYMGGNASNSYWSTGSPDTFGNFGNIGSNGNITLGGSSAISGNARPGPGKSVSDPSKVTGITTPLAEPLAFPPPDPGAYRTANDNGVVPSSFKSASSLSVGSSKALTLPGGVYYFNNVTVAGTLAFTGPASIYCYGSFSMSGRATTSAGLPENLKIFMCRTSSGAAPGYLHVGSSSALYADIYAPEAPVTLSGSGDIYGSVVGKSVTMTGTSAIHYDLALAGGGQVTLVR